MTTRSRPEHMTPTVRCGTFVLALLLFSLAAPLAVGAQPQKVYRIGMLERTSPAINAANLDGFRRGLRELGYVEEKNSSSSIDRPMAATNGSPPSRPSWFA
jgi:hypothetical protein